MSNSGDTVKLSKTITKLNLDIDRFKKYRGERLITISSLLKRKAIYQYCSDEVKVINHHITRYCKQVDKFDELIAHLEKIREGL